MPLPPSEKKYANLSLDRNVMKPPAQVLPKPQYRMPGHKFGSKLEFGKFTPKKPEETELPTPYIGGRSPAGPLALEKRVNRDIRPPKTQVRTYEDKKTESYTGHKTDTPRDKK